MGVQEDQRISSSHRCMPIYLWTRFDLVRILDTEAVD